MTDSQEPEGQNDLSAAPEYKQLGEDGNPFSNDSAGVDDVPAAHTDNGDDADQNPPLPDGGPTDGSHGVDGDA